MISPRNPIYLTHAPTPSVQGFALLAGMDAAVRGTLISVMPLAVYRAVGDAAIVSRLYFFVGIVALVCGMLVPWLSRHLPRRWLFTGGSALYLLGMSLAVFGGATGIAASLFVNAVATVVTFICFNAYLLDYIQRQDLGRAETMRMVYGALPWAVGPVLGVWLLGWWAPAPFALAGLFALAQMAIFWWLRLGNGKQITRARGPASNPLAYLGRFFQQPRLIAGWFFAVIRSCGWWVYVVYLPIYCIEAGLGDKIGGMALSGTNALLFVTPLMLRLVHKTSVRWSVRAAFMTGGLAFIAVTFFAGLPWVAFWLAAGASVTLIMLDVCGGLPFLMAVKPSERTEMSAVYSSFRDVSGIFTPGAACIVLLFAPVSGVFAACGVAMIAAWAVAGRLHPRLGAARDEPVSPEVVEA